MVHMGLRAYELTVNKGDGGKAPLSSKKRKRCGYLWITRRCLMLYYMFDDHFPSTASFFPRRLVLHIGVACRLGRHRYILQPLLARLIRGIVVNAYSASARVRSDWRLSWCLAFRVASSVRCTKPFGWKCRQYCGVDEYGIGCTCGVLLQVCIGRSLAARSLAMRHVEYIG